jgi:hypothetical protein
MCGRNEYTLDLKRFESDTAYVISCQRIAQSCNCKHSNVEHGKLLIAKEVEDHLPSCEVRQQRLFVN